MPDFKLISEDSRYVTYAHKTNHENLSVCFDKELKFVNISYTHFVFNEPVVETQWKDERLKQSCKYGHWQSESIVCLSVEDIGFINDKCRELFGKEAAK